MSLQRLINEVRELMDMAPMPEPDDDEEAEEAAPRKISRLGPGGSKKQAKVCPPGSHMVGGKCVRVPAAKLKVLAKKQRAYAKSSAGKKAARKAAKRRARLTRKKR